MNDKCIMPEMPYCPVCPHGYIVADFDEEDVEWICLLTGEEV